MREFFRGWRRKIGVMTLVMACVFAGVWTRSYVVRDVLHFGINGRQQAVIPLNGELCWWGWSAHQPVSWKFKRNNSPFTEGVKHERDRRMDKSNYADDRREWIIPYAIVVLPLTLLSAYLLLSKPRPMKPATVTTPSDDAQVTNA